MQVKQFESLGVKINLNIPSTVEEFDQNAKKAGACLDEAVNNIVYRGVLPDFRAMFCERVEKETGIARKFSTVKEGDKEVEVWDETEGKYMSRVRAEKGWQEDRTQLQAIADLVSPELVFDASSPEPKAKGPRKLPAGYATAALRIFGNGNQDKWAEKLGLTYVAETGNEDEVKRFRSQNVETLGWAIKKVEDEKRKAAELEYA